MGEGGDGNEEGEARCREEEAAVLVMKYGSTGVG